MDLTKITTPFGLLDKETQAALKAWPHGLEVYRGVIQGVWEEWDDEDLIQSMAYRACTEPPKPLELWIPMYGDFPGGGSYTEAEAREQNKAATRIVHVREVTEGAA